MWAEPGLRSDTRAGQVLLPSIGVSCNVPFLPSYVGLPLQIADRCQLELPGSPTVPCPVLTGLLPRGTQGEPDTHPP